MPSGYAQQYQHHMSLIKISLLHSVQVMVTTYDMLRQNLENLLEVKCKGRMCAGFYSG
jgi:hypothetical protein